MTEKPGLTSRASGMMPSWLKRHWGATAATIAILTAGIGFVTDVQSLIFGGALSQAEASILAESVATRLESRSIARGGEYRQSTTLDDALGALAQTGNRQDRRALAALEDGRTEEGLDELEEETESLLRRDPEAAAIRFRQIAIIAQTVDNARAARLFGRALELDPQDLRAMDLLGELELNRGNADAAQILHERALDLARQNGEEAEESSALSGLGSVAWSNGDLDSADTYYARSLEISDMNGNLTRSARQLGNRGLIAQARGDNAAAEQYYSRALALMQSSGDVVGEALARNNLGNIARDRGEFEEAGDNYRLSLSTLEAADRRALSALVIANLGRVAEERGDVAAAERFYERALNRAREYQYVRVIESTAQQAGWIRVRAGDGPGAVSLADESLRAASMIGDNANEADALILGVAAYDLTGQHDVVEDYATRALAIVDARENVSPDIFGYLHGALALIRYREGNLDAAEAHTQHAQAFYSQTTDFDQMALHASRMATILEARGDTVTACDHLGDAVAWYVLAANEDDTQAMRNRQATIGCSRG
jgi:tetratricopeptide (TPR) repeat protein